MPKIQRSIDAWGPDTGNHPGETLLVSVLTQAPCSLEIEPNPEYRSTWDTAGYFGVQILTGTLQGFVQKGEVTLRGGTLIYPRVRVLSVGPPSQTAAYAVFFQPHGWILSGTIRCFTDPDLAFSGQANYGAG